MKQKSKPNVIKYMSIALAFVMLFTLSVTIISSLQEDEAQARVTQAQINRLRAQRSGLAAERSEIEAKIDDIEFEMLGEIAKKEVLDARIAITNREIAYVNDTIRYLETMIREKEYAVFVAQTEEELHLQRFKSRVRAMEENGLISYLELLFDSTSFSDLLARLDFVRDIMRADEYTYAALQNARYDEQVARELLTESRLEIEEERLYLEILEVQLSEQLEEAHEVIRSIEDDLEAEIRLRDQIADELARLDSEINAAIAALRRQQEQERLRRQRELARQQATTGGSGTVVTGTGQLMWPMSGPVISGFRIPSRPNHVGIDIGGPYGRNIVAADGGRVVASRNNGGTAGEMIIIYHGNGIQTRYMHLSVRHVQQGQTVSRGQHIGDNGSTGNATTPHLHFEVLVNGVHVNPRSMLP